MEKVIFKLEISGLEHWGISTEEYKDPDYWDSIMNEIKDSLEIQFGRSNISITHKN